MVDFERLDAAITFAVEHPERIDMGTWFARTDCGTTACLAGTVALQAGWTPVFDHETYNLRGLIVTHEVAKGGETQYVKEVAAEVVGLDQVQADDMFLHAGDIRGAIAYRNEFAAAAGLPERTWAVTA